MAREAAKHPTAPRAGPTTEDYPAPSVCKAEDKRSRMHRCGSRRGAWIPICCVSSGKSLTPPSHLRVSIGQTSLLPVGAWLRSCGRRGSNHACEAPRQEGSGPCRELSNAASKRLSHCGNSPQGSALSSVSEDGVGIRLPSHISGDPGKRPAFPCPPCSALHVGTETQARTRVTGERDSFSQVPSRKRDSGETRAKEPGRPARA